MIDYFHAIILVLLYQEIAIYIEIILLLVSKWRNNLHHPLKSRDSNFSYVPPHFEIFGILSKIQVYGATTLCIILHNLHIWEFLISRFEEEA